MAIVKFDEGEKFETSLNLADDEGILFVKSPKNKIWRFVGNPTRHWTVNFVITSKRVAVIPQPPNKKNYPVESFYFKDIANAEGYGSGNKEEEARYSFFKILMKSKKESTHLEDGVFTLQMEMNFLNIIKSLIASDKAHKAKYGSAWNDAMQTMDYSTYTAASVDRYYAAMNKDLKERAKNMDFSNAKHNKLRDYIVDVINSCLEIANK